MISDKALVSPKAKIGQNVTIYPFAYIEDDVVIGDNCIIYPYVSIMNGTRMGSDNKVFQNTVLGAEPQDFNYRGDASQLIIGNGNIIRENVVVNRATFSDGQAVKSGESIRLVADLNSIANLRGTVKAEIKFAIEIKDQKKKAVEGLATFLYYFE